MSTALSTLLSRVSYNVLHSSNGLEPEFSFLRSIQPPENLKSQFIDTE